MSLVTNLAANPSGELDLTGWEEWATSSTLARVASSAATAGDYVIRATANVAGNTFGLEYATVPVVEGRTYTVAMDLRTSAGGWVRPRLDWRNSGGSIITPYIYGDTFAVGDGNAPLRRVSITAQAPAGAVALRIVFYVAQANGIALDVLASHRIEGDALTVTEGTDGTYHDGDTPGWAWNGAPHASSSSGPAAPYTPEAEVDDGTTGVGAYGDWFDVLTSYATETEAPVEVRLATGGARYVAARQGAGLLTGQMEVVFTRELATGTPGDRSWYLEDHLRGGGMLNVRFPAGELDPAGTYDLLGIYPTGRIRRELVLDTSGAARGAAWLVAFDWTRA